MAFKIETDKIEGLLIISPEVYRDSRGYFFESYHSKIFEEYHLKYHFIQDNQSKSVYGTIRGLHYQIEPFAQVKLVRVVQGEVLDVVLDIRQNSPTYGHKFEIVLSAENHKQLLVPKGFAHGFSVLSEEAVFCYKCDNYYHKSAERGIRFNDPALDIDWRLEASTRIVSEKDMKLPYLADAEINFVYHG